MIIAGLDVGTTGAKIALYDENAVLVNTYYNEYPSDHKNGNHEINFADIKNGVMGLLKKAAKEHKINAMAVTSFGETCALLGENDEILAPSMLYTDSRGSEECAEMVAKFGEKKLTLAAGVKPHSMYSIYKVMWQKKNNPELFAKCKHILLGEDFIVYSLTGNPQIDYSLAARTGAFDVENLCYIKEVLEFAGVDENLFSKPVPAGTVAGVLTEKVKAELGIDYDITVMSGCHDQVVAMIGSGAFDTDYAMDGTGTVECIPVILDKKPTDLEFYSYGYCAVPFLDGKFACYAFSFTGGATLKWFRDNFAEYDAVMAEKEGKNVYAELDSKIDSTPSGILVLPHFAGAATPYMDNDSKAAFVGVTLETSRYDLYKALMEGTSFEMLLNFDLVSKFATKPKGILASGGGTNSDVWLQIKADILNMSVTALSCKEIGAAGTAALAGVTMGVYEDLAETTAKMAKPRKVFYPSPENAERFAKLYKKYKNLYNAVKGL